MVSRILAQHPDQGPALVQFFEFLGGPALEAAAFARGFLAGCSREPLHVVDRPGPPSASKDKPAARMATAHPDGPPTPASEPKKAFQSDSTGPYTEVTGPVIRFGDHDDEDTAKVVISSEHGEVHGWAHGPMARKIVRHKAADRGTATIRVYNAGGGWYPDNRVVTWET